MNDDARTTFERWDEVPKDFDAILISPVVENGSEVVYIRGNWLFCEEVTATLYSIKHSIKIEHALTEPRTQLCP